MEFYRVFFIAVTVFSVRHTYILNYNVLIIIYTGGGSSGSGAGGSTPGAGSPAPVADYSAQWAEYYRSIGKTKEAEAIETQIKLKVNG